MSSQPPLILTHPESSLSPAKLTELEKVSTDDLKKSLEPGQKGSLKVRADGTVLDGHHRLYILKNRGMEVNALPREKIEQSNVKDLEVNMAQPKTQNNYTVEKLSDNRFRVSGGDLEKPKVVKVHGEDPEKAIKKALKDQTITDKLKS